MDDKTKLLDEILAGQIVAMEELLGSGEYKTGSGVALWAQDTLDRAIEMRREIRK